MQLVDIFPELLLHIASFLPQSDLLNVSLTCQRLHDVTEPELYREYINPHMVWDRSEGRSIKTFILRLVSRPDLAKYVRRVDLKAWIYLSQLSPEHGGADDDPTSDITANEYKVLANAAVAAGVITTISPFKETSSIWKNRADPAWMKIYEEGNTSHWCE